MSSDLHLYRDLLNVENLFRESELIELEKEFNKLHLNNNDTFIQTVNVKVLVSDYN